MLDQEFDKLSLLLFQTLALQKLLAVQFRTLRGRRGSGPALAVADGKHPKYICEVLSIFQGVMPPEHRLFNVIQTGKSRRFQPEVNNVDWDRWLNALDRRLREFLTGFVGIAEVLTEKEMIALDHTTDAVDFLVGEVGGEFRQFLAQHGVDAPKAYDSLDEAVTMARVGYEKVTSDKTAYEIARTRVVGGEESEARAAVLECRGSAEDIWAAKSFIDGVIPRATRLYRFAQVVEASLQTWRESQGLTPPRSDNDHALQMALSYWHDVSEMSDPSIPVEELRNGKVDTASRALEQCLDTLCPKATARGQGGGR